MPLKEHDTPVQHEMVDAIALRQAIERLPQHLREAIELVYIEGLTQQGAARRLGITQQAVRLLREALA